MVELVLHIGTGKTGTTSIQDFLFGNEKELREQGIYLPKYGRQRTRCAYHRVACSLARSYPRHTEPHDSIEGYLSRQRKELRHDIHTVLMSSEFFRGISKTAVRRLQETALQHYSKVRIVLYLRRQDTYVESSYKQIIKGGGVLTFREAVDHGIGSRDWEQLVNKWASVFGRENVIPRPFNKDLFVNGKLEDDFLSAIGAEPIERTAVATARPTLSNVSLPNDLIEVKRRINVIMGGLRGKPENGRLVKALDAYKSKNGGGASGSLFDLQQHAEFLERFDESNARLFQVAMPGQRNPLGWTYEELKSTPRWQGIRDDLFAACLDFIEEVDPPLGAAIKDATAVECHATAVGRVEPPNRDRPAIEGHAARA